MRMDELIGGDAMLLGPSQPPHVVFQPPPRRIEGVAERHEDILVRMVEVMIAVDDDLAAGHDEIDTHAVEPPLAVVPVRLGDDDVAAGDPVRKPLQLRDMVERRIADRIVDRQVIERNLWLRLHGGSLQPVAVVAGVKRRRVVPASGKA